MLEGLKRDFTRIEKAIGPVRDLPIEGKYIGKVTIGGLKALAEDIRKDLDDEVVLYFDPKRSVLRVVDEATGQRRELTVYPVRAPGAEFRRRR